jgi:hypothetical protein
VGCAGRPAVGVDPRELQHVEAFLPGREDVAPLACYELHARVADPVPEVLRIAASQDSHGRRVDLDRGDAGCAEVERVQDVEAAPTPMIATRGFATELPW